MLSARRARLVLGFAVLVTYVPSVPAQDPRAAAEAEILRFLAEWHELWKASETDRHSLEYRAAAGGSAGFTSGAYPGGRERHAAYGCAGGFRDYPDPPSRIPQRLFGFAVCPTWFLGPIVDAVDERFGIDGALAGPRRTLARAKRDLLLDTLAELVRSAPTSDFTVGALVRFLVDQQEYESADSAALDCRATPWWCESLRGYAAASRGDIATARAMYVDALTAMDRETRCARTDYSVLLDSIARPLYARAGCAGRDSANAVLWWLADPMLTDSINERWVEQMTRDIHVELRSAVGRDERYSWAHAQARAARGELLFRYGPPSYSFWGGPVTDKMQAERTSREPSPPYTTYEYEPGRVSVVPSAAALIDPFRAPGSAWNLNPPPGGTQATLRGIWWPREHFAARFPIVQLPEGQTALLRRDVGVLVAFATDIEPSHIGWPGGTAIDDVELVTSHLPGSVERVTKTRAVAGVPLIVRGVVPRRPALIGVEYPAAGKAGPPAGRARFGITPPPSLAEMRAGEIAISEPVFLRVPSDATDLPRDTTALDQLATSRRVRSGERVGVYWETYGLLSTDTVEVAVWVERYTRDGAMRRLGQTLRMATNRNTPVAVSWMEPSAGVPAHFVAAGVPVVTRSIVLDTSTLPAGEYWLDVAVRKRGEEPVRSRVSFVIDG